MNLKHSGKPLDEWRLVHGIVVGEGNLTGIEFGHSWMELGKEWEYRLVFDHSNNREISMSAMDYYSRGEIKPENVRRYTIEEAMKFMRESEHFGPWDPFFRKWP